MQARAQVLLLWAAVVLLHGASASLTAPKDELRLHEGASCATASPTVGQTFTIYQTENSARYSCQQVGPDVYAAIWRMNDGVYITRHTGSSAQRDCEDDDWRPSEELLFLGCNDETILNAAMVAVVGPSDEPCECPAPESTEPPTAPNRRITLHPYNDGGGATCANARDVPGFTFTVYDTESSARNRCQPFGDERHVAVWDIGGAVGISEHQDSYTGSPKSLENCENNDSIVYGDVWPAGCVADTVRYNMAVVVGGRGTYVAPSCPKCDDDDDGKIFGLAPTVAAAVGGGIGLLLVFGGVAAVFVLRSKSTAVSTPAAGGVDKADARMTQASVETKADDGDKGSRGKRGARSKGRASTRPRRSRSPVTP